MCSLTPRRCDSCSCPLFHSPDANEDATRRRQRRLMVKREQAERSRQRLEQKVKLNELQQQLAAKKDRYGCADRGVFYFHPLHCAHQCLGGTFPSFVDVHHCLTPCLQGETRRVLPSPLVQIPAMKRSKKAHRASVLYVQRVSNNSALCFVEPLPAFFSCKERMNDRVRLLAEKNKSHRL